MNESCHTYEWVMSHIWMSHGTHMNDGPCATHRNALHYAATHVHHIRNESCHTRDTARSHVSHLTRSLCNRNWQRRMRNCANSAGENSQKSAHLVILQNTFKSATTVQNFRLSNACATAHFSKVSSRSHFTSHTEKRIDSWDFLLFQRMRNCENYAGNLFQKWAHISHCI